jgi:predicted DsbA family dithiol-disulfide isomerase
MVRFDIFSDPICPWCYIGKTHLDRAIKRTAVSFIDIRWHPFQLNPDMPLEGMDRRAYLEQKFGGQSGAVKAYAPVVEHAQKAGLQINFEAIKRTPNTLNAHRLIHWSEAEGCQNALVDALFDAYFVQGKDIGNAEELCEIAQSAGMNSELAARLLATDSDMSPISERDQNARKMGIGAVPTFVVAGQHVVQGGQSEEFWNTVITEISDNIAQAELS